MNCDFSLKHYREILKTALESGFVITNYKDSLKYKNAEKIILLRHDVDALPEQHLAIAKIENSLKVKSTYFVRVHGQYYYPDSPKTLKIFQAILKMGHEIGLHTDARSLNQVFKMSELDLFLSEKKYLENLLKIKIQSASEHGDLKRKDDFWQKSFLNRSSSKSLDIKHYPQEFKNIKYLSDSLGKWREGCLCQKLTKFSKIQVLTHAEWWGKDAREKMISLNKAYAKI